MSDIDKADKKAKEIERKVEAEGELISGDRWQANEPLLGGEVDRFGICKSCMHFCYTEYELSGDIAECRHWDRMMTGVQRISRCTGYSKRGALTLDLMLQMATMIDVDKKDTGFIR